MNEPAWETTRRAFGVAPILSCHVGGSTPLLVERYLFRATQIAVSGLSADAVLIQFGGGMVEEGPAEAARDTRTTRVATQGILVPKGVSTHWRYSGAMDVGIFYLLDGGDETVQRLKFEARSRTCPIPFSDALVSAAGMQLVHEIQRSGASPSAFCARLAAVMLERLASVLTTPAHVEINPRHVHLSRMQEVLNFIRDNPSADLSVSSLSARVGVSRPHFYRIFLDSTGMSPHQYVLAKRLELVRVLLTQSNLPSSRIAEHCGFSSASHMTTIFRREHWTTPAKYRRKDSGNSTTVHDGRQLTLAPGG